MAQGKAHDRDKVAKVLADLYLSADSQEQIAQKHDVSRESVSLIKKRYFADFARLKMKLPSWPTLTRS